MTLIKFNDFSSGVLKGGRDPLTPACILPENEKSLSAIVSIKHTLVTQLSFGLWHVTLCDSVKCSGEISLKPKYT